MNMKCICGTTAILIKLLQSNQKDRMPLNRVDIVHLLKPHKNISFHYFIFYCITLEQHIFSL